MDGMGIANQSDPYVKVSHNLEPINDNSTCYLLSLIYQVSIITDNLSRYLSSLIIQQVICYLW